MCLVRKVSVYLLGCATLVSGIGPSGASQDVRVAAFGDYGANNANELAVAALVNGWNVDCIVTTGDNSYGSSSIDLNIGKYFSSYIGAYTGAYGAGAETNKFFPSLGNHDYTDGAGVSAYLTYFTLPGDGIVTTATSGNERYYDFMLGPIHFFSINSYAAEPDGVTSSSLQAQWLQQQLASSTAPWKIVYLHYPPYSSSTSHGSTPALQWPYEDWGVTAVLAGHDHTYERIMRDDDADGDSLAYFVTGLGGRSIYSFPSSGFEEGSTVRYNSAYGSMLIEADSQQIRFYFISVVSGGTPVDSLIIGECCQGDRGDINGDGIDMDGVDLSLLVDYLFNERPVIWCLPEGDVNGDLVAADPVDLSYAVDFLFNGGPAPVMCP